jgi:hypothetical protein
MIVTHEQKTGTRKPRVQGSMNVQGWSTDADKESPNPVQTCASNVKHTSTQQVTGQDGEEVCPVGQETYSTVLHWCR